MKKVIKIVLGLVFLAVIALVAIPFLFKDKIVSLIETTVNENVNANIKFSDASLSLLRNFPKASLVLDNVAVTNVVPFEGDTLFYAQEINLKLKLTDVFKASEKQLNINAFTIDNALINILVNEEGKANYDIAKESTTTEEDTTDEGSSSDYKLSVASYAINNSTIRYNDNQGKMHVALSDFSHSGTGDFSQNNVKLKTNTNTGISFTMDNSNLVDNLHLDLDALLDLDLANSKFSFLENEAHINQLPLIFDGFVQLHETTQEIHVNFKTPSSDFKNFLALVPQEYAKNIADVQTTGDFSIAGKVDGIVSDTTIPKLDITIKSNNASFKYPDLPKGVENITIDTQIKNNTGIVDDTFVNLNKLHFKIDNNEFDGKATVKHLTGNPAINTTIKGTVNLADITKVYPIETAKELSGVITSDITSSFDMDAVTNHKPERIHIDGTVELNDFVFDGDDVAHPVAINSAKVDFKTEKISLTKFDAKTGDSDLNATGTIDNLLDFILADGNLEGNFTLNSNTFKVSDFMTEATETPSDEQKSKETTTEETLKIPAFLDCTVSANAKEVYYDDLKLQNVKGTLILKDETATLKGVNGAMFGGKITMNGAVDTKKDTPVFDMDLGIQSFDIATSFAGLEMFKMLSPIANIFKGDLNTSMSLKGSLNDDFTPNLNTLNGDALAEILASNINPDNSKALSLLNNNLSFINLNEVDVDNVKTKLSFEDGKVNVEPFNLNYKDIGIAIGGSHSLDQTMDYDATFNVPAKYLGKEATALLAKLDESDANTLVPITANITGNFTSPSVKTDLKSAVTNLTTTLAKKQIEKQKSKLLDKAVGGLLGSKTSSNNTSTKTTISNTIGGLLNKKENTTTNKSSANTKVKDEAVEKAGKVINGLFGKKK